MSLNECGQEGVDNMRYKKATAQDGDMPLISVENIGVQRGQNWLIRNISLKIQPGEIITIIGPNGAGKSTLAKAILGAIPINEGQIIHHQKPSIGYVPQKLNIDNALPITVDRLMQLTARAPANARQAALAACGIEHLRKEPIGILSGGEFQRCLLARAILNKPDLLVLDEPVQGVDFAGESALYDLIRNIRDETGCAVLMISHDLHIVMAETDTVLCLNGHICCRGAPDIVASNPEYLRLFGPAIDGLAIYQHHHDHQHLPDGRVQHADGTITDDCHPDDGHHHDDHHDAPAKQGLEA